MTAVQRERLLAVLAATGATAYIALARDIEDSLLSDAVGAGGVPQGVGIAVAVAAVALFARTWLRQPQSAPEGESFSRLLDLSPRPLAGEGAPKGRERAGATPVDNPTRETEADAARPGPAWPVIARTSALVLILLVFAAALPLLGYALSISALVLACGWLAGAPFKLPLWLCAAGAGPGLWLLFDQLLQVRMPVGTLWG